MQEILLSENLFKLYFEGVVNYTCYFRYQKSYLFQAIQMTLMDTQVRLDPHYYFEK